MIRTAEEREGAREQMRFYGPEARAMRELCLTMDEAAERIERALIRLEAVVSEELADIRKVLDAIERNR